MATRPSMISFFHRQLGASPRSDRSTDYHSQRDSPVQSTQSYTATQVCPPSLHQPINSLHRTQTPQAKKNSVVCLHTICQSGQSNTPITKQVSLTNYWLLPFFAINKGILKTDHKEMQCTQNLIESQKIIQNENNCNKRESCITLLVQCPDTPVL